MKPRDEHPVACHIEGGEHRRAIAVVDADRVRPDKVGDEEGVEGPEEGMCKDLIAAGPGVREVGRDRSAEAGCGTGRLRDFCSRSRKVAPAFAKSG